MLNIFKAKKNSPRDASDSPEEDIDKLKEFIVGLKIIIKVLDYCI